MAKPSYRLVEVIVAVSVVIISIASLFVAVYQGIVMDRTLKASVLPIIQAGTSNLDPETGSFFPRDIFLARGALESAC